MDWVFFFSTIKWSPWYIVSYDNFIIQFLCIYLFISFLSVYNYFTVLLYLFLFLFLFSSIIGLMQLDLFLGFFIVIELSVIFVGVILLFFLNPKGVDFVVSTLKKDYLFFILTPTIIFFMSLPYFSLGETYLFNFNYIYTWDNYYESIHFLIKNDFSSLFFSYYVYNSLVFLLVGFILFIGSLMCINLNNKIVSSKKKDSSKYVSNFKKLKSFMGFSFMRRQDLNVQTHANIAIKIVSKKNGSKKLNTSARK